MMKEHSWLLIVLFFQPPMIYTLIHVYLVSLYLTCMYKLLGTRHLTSFIIKINKKIIQKAINKQEAMDYSWIVVKFNQSA